LYIEVGYNVFSSNTSQDTFTQIENDALDSFGQFIASITLCRIALLQIVPSLTLCSNFASAVASTPLFVLSDKMNKKLPPLIFTNFFTDTKAMLEKDHSSTNSRLRVWFFGYYRLINHSRLIQFLLNGYQSIVSMAIIFFPHYLHLLVPILVAILLHCFTKREAGSAFMLYCSSRNFSSEALMMMEVLKKRKMLTTAMTMTTMMMSFSI
jgi:hypothetical protein